MPQVNLEPITGTDVQPKKRVPDREAPFAAPTAKELSEHGIASWLAFDWAWSRSGGAAATVALVETQPARRVADAAFVHDLDLEPGTHKQTVSYAELRGASRSCVVNVRARACVVLT